MISPGLSVGISFNFEYERGTRDLTSGETLEESKESGSRHRRKAAARQAQGQTEARRLGLHSTARDVRRRARL